LFYNKTTNILKVKSNEGIKMIEVSTHSKYITEKDLLEWENSLKGDNKVKRLINKSVSE